MEVLEREKGILNGISGEHVDNTKAHDKPAGPSSKVEVDPSLEAEASKLKFNIPEKPKRDLPRPSQLHVQQIVMQVRQPKHPLAQILAVKKFLLLLL